MQKKVRTINYANIDLMKYIFSIVIIILHLRPFLNISNELDFLFNNSIGRVCVPFFFFVSGYFFAEKEKKDKHYIKKYTKSSISLYLFWCSLYLPILIIEYMKYIPIAIQYLQQFSIPFFLMLPLLILSLPLLLVVALLYTGTYYHLWYFPALLLSIVIVTKWKSKFSLKYLVIIAGILLCFGATETYFGIFPAEVKQWLSYYFNIFFTTRNFLFFGLFYVVFGYIINNQKQKIVSNLHLKLLLSVFLLFLEATFLQQIERLNSNILLSCVPLVYYLFAYITTTKFTISNERSYDLRSLSKYYYLTHPLIIFFFSFVQFRSNNIMNAIMLSLLVILSTHIFSLGIIMIKQMIPTLHMWKSTHLLRKREIQRFNKIN